MLKKLKFNPVTTYPSKGSHRSGVIDLKAFPLVTQNEFEEIIGELGRPFVAVGFELPFCIHLEDGIYPCVSNGERHVVKQKKVGRKEVLYLGGTGVNVELQDDPRGLFRYSIVEVYFQDKFPDMTNSKHTVNQIKNMADLLNTSSLIDVSIKTLPSIQQKEFPNEEKVRIESMNKKTLKERFIQIANTLDMNQQVRLYDDLRARMYLRHAIKAINRFINVYREITKSFYMPNLRDSDVLGLSICSFPKTGATKMQRTSRFPNGLTLSVPDKEIEVHERIWSMLDMETPIEIYREMLHTAQRYLLEENYPGAVVEAFSAFELFIEQILRDALTKKGMSCEKVEEYLETDRNWQITVRVKILYKEILGEDLTANPEYQAWFSAKKLRDEIVHEGKRDIAEDDAVGAVSAINHMLESIKKLIES